MKELSLTFKLLVIELIPQALLQTYLPVTFRSVHTGIDPPFLFKIYYESNACMTQGFTSRKYKLKEK